MDTKLQITCSTVAAGTEEWDWLQARTACVPGDGPLCLTIMNQTQNRFTHDYGDIYQTMSRDGGGTSPLRSRVPYRHPGPQWSPAS